MKFNLITVVCLTISSQVFGYTIPTGTKWNDYPFGTPLPNDTLMFGTLITNKIITYTNFVQTVSSNVNGVTPRQANIISNAATTITLTVNTNNISLVTLSTNVNNGATNIVVKLDLVNTNSGSGGNSSFATNSTYSQFAVTATNVVGPLNANNLTSGTVPLTQLSGITSNQLDATTWNLATNSPPPLTTAQSNILANAVTNGGTIQSYKFLGTSNNFISIDFCPMSKYLGTYVQTYTNTISGNPYVVFSQIGSTNYLILNDVNWVNTFTPQPPFWTLQNVTNDTSLAADFITTVGASGGTGIVANIPYALWSNGAGTTNYTISVHYTYFTTNAQKLLYPLKFTWQTSSPNRFVDANFGDDGNDGFTPVTPMKSPYTAMSSTTTNGTIYLAAGNYPAWNCYFPGYVFVGAGKGATIITNTMLPNVSEQFENMTIRVLRGQCNTGEQLNVFDCELGGLDQIDGWYPSSPVQGTVIFKNCYLHSLFDTVNLEQSSAGSYVKFDGCKFEAIATITNGINATRCLNLGGSARVDIVNCSMVISNPAVGNLAMGSEFTNGCVVLNGSLVNLFVGNNSFDTSGTTNSAAIQYTGGASLSQVHTIYGLYTGTFTGNGGGLTNLNWVLTNSLTYSGTNTFTNAVKFGTGSYFPTSFGLSGLPVGGGISLDGSGQTVIYNAVSGTLKDGFGWNNTSQRWAVNIAPLYADNWWVTSNQVGTTNNALFGGTVTANGFISTSNTLTANLLAATNGWASGTVVQVYSNSPAGTAPSIWTFWNNNGTITTLSHVP